MGSIALIDGTNGERLPIKPTFGSACNGCGWCCAAGACGVATDFIPDHPAEGPCQALEHDAGRFVCGMIRRPSFYMHLPNDWADGVLGNMIADALGAGRGCDADGPEPHGSYVSRSEEAQHVPNTDHPPLD